MRPLVLRRLMLLAVVLGGCSTGAPTSDPTASATGTATMSPGATAQATIPGPSPAALPSLVVPPARTLLFDTDVAADDLVALSVLVAAPNVALVAVTVSGTGEAHCEGGLDVVLRLLERLNAPDIPVACGRETPLAGDHAFPDAWREHVDGGSGLDLPSTDRRPSTSTAVELITRLAGEHEDLTILATGPLTNVADALQQEPSLAQAMGPVFVMGGALHVPGNLVCCGAPEGNDVAEWNIYVDPHAANVVVASGTNPSFISLDGTNQVPVTAAFAQRAMEPSDAPGRRVLADLFAANPFMAEGGYYLWDPLAALIAAGYPLGTFTPAAIVVEEAEGPESGFTRPTSDAPNIQYLTTVDPAVAETTLLLVLSGG